LGHCFSYFLALFRAFFRELVGARRASSPQGLPVPPDLFFALTLLFRRSVPPFADRQQVFVHFFHSAFHCPCPASLWSFPYPISMAGIFRFVLHLRPSLLIIGCRSWISPLSAGKPTFSLSTSPFKVFYRLFDTNLSGSLRPLPPCFFPSRGSSLISSPFFNSLIQCSPPFPTFLVALSLLALFPPKSRSPALVRTFFLFGEKLVYLPFFSPRPYRALRRLTVARCLFPVFLFTPLAFPTSQSVMSPVSLPDGILPVTLPAVPSLSSSLCQAFRLPTHA